MTLDHMIELWNSNLIDGEYLHFDDVPVKRSSRPDIHAFILLNELLPGTTDIISAVEHDILYLDIEPEGLARVVTEAQLIELARCGIIYDESTDSLYMNV